VITGEYNAEQPPVSCRFVDERDWFFSVLSGKLGNWLSLSRATPEELGACPDCDVVIIGLPAPDSSDYSAAFATLQRLALNSADVPVIAFLKTPEREVMRDVISAGAFDYFVETSSMDELRIVLRRTAHFHELNAEAARLRASAQKAVFSSIVTTDPKMIAICRLASKVADGDSTILITGETGTGKELFAHAIHQEGARSRHPFVAVACSSLPETLIEAELFGHEKGAFTGALSARKGRFEAAEHGTIFLDEIGELSANLQVKLLRVLQERTFERLGSNQSRPMLARVICATNCHLGELVKAGKFRMDLFYRLNTIEIPLPPLRMRRDDIAVLAHCFLQLSVDRHKRPARRIGTPALAALQEYDWPGNIRELQNVIERAVVLCDGRDIHIEHLPERFWGWAQDTTVSFEDEVRNFKRRLIQRTLVEYGNNKLQAARSLKIARSSLHRLLSELEITEPDGAAAEDVGIEELPNWLSPKKNNVA
jgi:DNA-binding NtrC family response regulator